MATRDARKKKIAAYKRARRMFGNTLLYSWESMCEPDGQRISHGESKVCGVWRQLTQPDVDVIISNPHNWAICCRALCTTGVGTWVESEIVSAHSLKINDLAEHYDVMRAAVLASVQEQHVCDVGWIVASFNDKDKIDTGFENKHLGTANDDRRTLWKYFKNMNNKAK